MMHQECIDHHWTLIWERGEFPSNGDVCIIVLPVFAVLEMGIEFICRSEFLDLSVLVRAGREFPKSFGPRRFRFLHMIPCFTFCKRFGLKNKKIHGFTHEFRDASNVRIVKVVPVNKEWSTCFRTI